MTGARPPRLNEKAGLGCLLLAISVCSADQALASAGECVRIYYDSRKGTTYQYGRSSAIFLQNLLGHFSELRQVVGRIEDYQQGQVEECRATFYVATYYDNVVPKAFLHDFAATRRRVAWIGYSLWRLGPDRMKATLGVRFLGTEGLNTAKRDAEGRPTFYKDIVYKGETFSKYGEMGRHPNELVGDFELNALERVSSDTEILAYAIHNGDRSKLPYAIRRANKFYVADVPFSYTHDSDRYLVFADLLFDILDLPPRHNRKWAVFRIEDVHARLSGDAVLNVARIAKTLDVPVHVSIIPVFIDPYGALGFRVARRVPMSEAPAFVATIGELQKLGARFIWHGVTHQYENRRNPYGAPGYDYEFWDIVADAPVSDDSARAVLGRLNQGWQSLSGVGLAPKIWEVPHYRASALNYLIFARVFAWNIGRIYYQPFDAQGLPRQTTDLLWYEKSGLAGHAARESAFEGLSVTTSGVPLGQFFPYEIYRDVYGQRIFPENLGFVNYSATRGNGYTVDQILQNAKRNLVLRDVWGSLFYHPYFIGRAGAPEDLKRLLKSMQDLGYRFIDLEELISRWE